MTGWRPATLCPLSSRSCLTYCLKRVNVARVLTSSPIRPVSHWLKKSELRCIGKRPTLTSLSQNSVSNGQSSRWALVSSPSRDSRWNTKFLMRSDAVRGVPRAFTVSKISREFSFAVRLIATRCNPRVRHAGRRPRALAGALSVCVQPLRHGFREVLVRSHDPRGGVTKHFVIDGCLGIHHLVERRGFCCCGGLSATSPSPGHRCPRCASADRAVPRA